MPCRQAMSLVGHGESIFHRVYIFAIFNPCSIPGNLFQVFQTWIFIFHGQEHGLIAQPEKIKRITVVHTGATVHKINIIDVGKVIIEFPVQEISEKSIVIIHGIIKPGEQVVKIFHGIENTIAFKAIVAFDMSCGVYAVKVVSFRLGCKITKKVIKVNGRQAGIGIGEQVIEKFMNILDVQGALGKIMMRIAAFSEVETSG